MLLEDLPIPIDREVVAQFCRAYGIKRLGLFGSVTRKDFASTSDVDVLVEYLKGRHPGLMLFRQQDELAGLFRCPVDLHTPDSLSQYFREEVLVQMIPVYEQA